MMQHAMPSLSSSFPPVAVDSSMPSPSSLPSFPSLGSFLPPKAGDPTHLLTSYERFSTTIQPLLPSTLLPRRRDRAASMTTRPKDMHLDKNVDVWRCRDRTERAH